MALDGNKLSVSKSSFLSLKKDEKKQYAFSITNSAR